jgi:hypothetical protein
MGEGLEVSDATREAKHGHIEHEHWLMHIVRRALRPLALLQPDPGPEDISIGPINRREWLEETPEQEEHELEQELLGGEPARPLE